MNSAKIPNNQLELNTPILINGELVVIIEDELSSIDKDYETELNTLVRIDNTNIEVKGEIRDVQIFVAEEALRQARERHRDASIFGFWQIVLANHIVPGALDPAADTYVYQTSAGCGQYLVIDEGEINAGAFSGGIIPGRVGLSLDSAQQIEIDPQRIYLPENDAKLPDEVQAEFDQAKKTTLLRIGVVAAAIGLLAGSADYGLSYVFEQKQDEVRALQDQLKQAKDEANQLRRTRVDQVPDQRYAISQILRVIRTADVSFGIGGDISNGANTTLSDAQIVMKANPDSMLPFGFQTQRLQDGSVLILVPLRDGG